MKTKAFVLLAAAVLSVVGGMIGTEIYGRLHAAPRAKPQHQKTTWVCLHSEWLRFDCRWA
jgi:hypothetical protein